MKVRIVRIGNSRGIRIPKPLLDQTGFGEEVEIEVRGASLILRRPREVREGWSEEFRAMAESGDDVLLDGDLSTTSWDDEEWEWE